MRKALTIFSLWIPAAVVLITWLLWQNRLPNELPTHWSGNGPADASTPAQTFWITILAVTVVAAIAGSIIVLTRITGRWTQRAVAATTGAVAAFAASMWIGSSAPALDVADPLTVHLGAWILLTLFSPLYGLIQLALLPPGEQPQVNDLHTEMIAPLKAKPGQTIAWRTTTTSRMFIIITIMMAALTIGIGLLAFTQAEGAVMIVTLIIMILSTLLCALFCRFQITADRRGLRVISVLLGLPIKRIRPDEIKTIEVAIIDPMQWGGWGYRVIPGASALVLKAGPGLIITKTNEKQFAITLDHPQKAASVLLHYTA